MKVSFTFKPGALEAAYVDAVLESEALHIFVSIEFLVDTGATKTTISDRDAVRLGIDYLTLEKINKGMLGIGGAVDVYMLKDSSLIFDLENNQKHIERLESLCVLKHSEVNERILRIPSILGRDVLNKYALIYDKRQEKAYLTDELKRI